MKKMNKLELFEGLSFAFVALLIFMIFSAALYVVGSPDREMLASVQSGEVELTCNFKDGWRSVNPDLVTGYFEGVWQFKNGSAKQCKIN